MTIIAEFKVPYITGILENRHLPANHEGVVLATDSRWSFLSNKHPPVDHGLKLIQLADNAAICYTGSVQIAGQCIKR